MSNQQISFILAGVGVGAITALLLTPKPGSELRAGVRDAVADGLDSMRDAVERRRDVVEYTVKEGVAAFKEAREAFLEA